jgi:hypothetical protein
MLNNFFGNGLLLSCGISLTIVVIGACSYEGAESLITWMGGNVHTSTTEDVIVGNDDGRSVEVIGECRVTAHDGLSKFKRGDEKPIKTSRTLVLDDDNDIILY